MKKNFILIIFLFLNLLGRSQFLDPAFGSAGEVGPVYGFSSSTFDKSMALQADGKIVVAGATYNGSNYDFAALRLNTDGSIDNSFGYNGIRSFDIGNSNDFARSVAIQGDGKIVLTGYRYYTVPYYYYYSCGGWGGGTCVGTGYNYYYDIVVIRLNSDGSPDNTFDGDGIKIIDLTQNDYGNSLALQPDGKILIGGQVTSGAVLIRLNTDGSMDGSFNGYGYNINNLSPGINSLAIQSDGKILAVGQGTNSDFEIVRVTADGILDNSFDGDGKKLIDIDNSTDAAFSVAVQEDGKIVVGGYAANSTNSRDFALVRLNNDGSLDNSFDGDGKTTIDFNNNYDEGHTVLVQKNGKIIISGSVYNGSNYDYGITQLNADGTLDNTFGTDGKFSYDFGAYDYEYFSLMQPDGKLLVGGATSGYLGVIRLELNDQVVTLSCPGNVTVNTDKDKCEAVVNSIDPIVSPANAIVNYKIEKDGVELETGTGSVSGKTFNKGATTVTYTVADDPTKLCSFTVTVEDKQKPTVIAQNITVQLDENGNATITPSQINDGSNDNCTAAENLQLALDKTSFNCSNLGPNTVTLTVTDENNNSNTATATIIIEDKIKPIADLETLPDLTGECSVNVSTAPTATDNCKGSITGTTTDPLTYNAQGENTITWTYDDGNGNTSTQIQKVIVKDKTAPIPDLETLPDLTAECSFTVSTYPTATDNCKGSITATTDDPLTYSDQGNYTIHWKFDDGNGNVTTQQQNVIIKDVTPPYFDAIADQIIIMNPATCSGKVPNLILGLHATDNCSGTVTFTQSIPADQEYATTNGAVQIVTITADDGHGNTFSRDVKLISKDNAPPVFTCPQAQTVTLGSSCSIVVPDLISGLTGDPQCGTISFTQSPLAGTVISSSNGAITNVIITASDGNENSTQCTVLLTAIDVTKPFITCPAAKTISCDASILPANTGTATAIDNCDPNPSITYTDVSTQDPDITKAGHYNYTITRTWKAIDNAPNSNTCDQILTVQDITAPTAKCKSIEVYLGLDGTVSITGAQVDNGSSDNCSPVTLSVSPNSFNTLNVGSNNVTLTVTDASGNSSTCQTTVTVKKRPTVLVYTGDGSEQYSDQQFLTAVLKDQITNTVLSSELVSFTIGIQTTSGTTDVSGTATANLILTQDPMPVYTVNSNFAGDAIFLPSSDSDPFDILQEDARAYYSGALFASTSGTSTSTANVTLSATIKDISAVSGDPSYDVFKGDIRNATVTFVNRDDGSILASNVPVGLVNLSDLTVGTATKTVTLNIGTADAKQFTIGIIVNNYYTRNNSSEDAIVTVSKPLDNFVTGGGYIVLTNNSAGQKAGTPGTNNNFGFNIKFNKSNTNLQGNINTIIRRMESDNVLHVYQIKGNSMTSLAVNSSVSTAKTATFNGRANIQDITNPLAPVSIDGNATLQVTMTDRGEPGNTDDIGITVWNKSGGLWYSSNWNGIKTVNQTLTGGNIKVNGASYNASSGTALTLARVHEFSQSEVNVSTLNITGFPNPSAYAFNISVKSNDVNSKITLRVTDILGRTMEVKENIRSGQTISIGENLRPGTYIIEAIQNKQSTTIKLVKLSD